MIRFIKRAFSHEIELEEFDEVQVPPYAILSHTWIQHEEVTYQDLLAGTCKKTSGFTKIEFCLNQARADGLHHGWVDTCCIDRTNNNELTTAINSMFRWYKNASICYVYLSDVSTEGIDVVEPACRSRWLEALKKSRWFTRGWTLQELLAPLNVIFFSKEGVRLGDKVSLEETIVEATGIPATALRNRSFDNFTVQERFGWAKNRFTTLGEDKTYCLLGIFGVFLPLIYGEGQAHALMRLEEEIQKRYGQPDSLRKPSCGVPFRRDPQFVSRVNIQKALQEKCSGPSSRVALVGLGGVGKSQLAIEHCYQTLDASPNTWIFWLYASSVARLEKGFQNIANQVGLLIRDGESNDTPRLVHDWLRNHGNGNWLLIVDNLDDHTLFPSRKGGQGDAAPSRSLLSYIPQSLNGSVVLTSRNKAVALQMVEADDIIDVVPMSDLDARTLLRLKLGTSYKEEDALELASVVDFMPLALVQAASYIRQRVSRYSIRQYTEDFRKSDKKRATLLQGEAGQLRRDGQANNSILLTWQISFDHIGSARPSAADLLSLMSFFDRQGIAEELLRPKLDESMSGRGSESSMDDRFEDDVKILRDYSLISQTIDVATFEMHSLVQLATRRWLAKQGRLDHWRDRFITCLAAGFPSTDQEHWAQFRVLLPHTELALQQRPASPEALERWATLLHDVAWYLCSGELMTNSFEMADGSWQVRKELFGDNHRDTLDSKAMVASALRVKGQWAKSRDMRIEILETSRATLGHEDLDTLARMNDLALLYRDCGQPEEAEQLLQQLLECSFEVLSSEELLRLTGMSNLALLYMDKAKWVKAEELQLKVLGTRIRLFGEDNPSTLRVMGNLASNYNEQHRWDEGEKMLLKVLDGKRRQHGENHPNTLTDMDNLACLYRDSGRLAEAEALRHRVTKLARESFGDEHPYLGVCLRNLASTHTKQGRWKEAVELNTQSLEITRKAHGPQHPDALTAANNLATSYMNQERWKDAEDLLRYVVQTNVALGRDDDQHILTAIHNLGHTVFKQGHTKEAMGLMSECNNGRSKILGPDHAETVEAKTCLEDGRRIRDV